MDDFVPYERMRLDGDPSTAACGAARASGEDFFFAIRMLRAVYLLDLVEARDIAAAEFSSGGTS